jgi:hypothetical protein
MTRTTVVAAALLVGALLACKKEEKKESAPAPTPAPAAETATAPAAPAAETAAAPAKAADDPIPDIPSGRSNPPSVSEWSAAAEVNTQGANARPDDCFMKIVREWLKVHATATWSRSPRWTASARKPRTGFSRSGPASRRTSWCG